MKLELGFLAEIKAPKKCNSTKEMRQRHGRDHTMEVQWKGTERKWRGATELWSKNNGYVSN